MRFNLDDYFGIQQKALLVHERRNTAIAANLANADTPGYKARDIDFRAALAEAAGTTAQTLRTSDPRHLAGSNGSAGAELAYRVPLQPAQDGNTVETDREQAAFAENAVRYQASLQFLGGSIRSLITAIQGGSNR
jgi:flagellar basal-body rod protein FlgB